MMAATTVASKHCNIHLQASQACAYEESMFVRLCYPILRGNYWFLVAVHLLFHSISLFIAKKLAASLTLRVSTGS